MSVLAQNKPFDLRVPFYNSVGYNSHHIWLQFYLSVLAQIKPFDLGNKDQVVWWFLLSKRLVIWVNKPIKQHLSKNKKQNKTWV